MSWKKLLESASESLNDHIRLRNDYVLAENRILRNQIDGRVPLTDIERKELAEIGAKLGKKALEVIATIAKPDTIFAWNRRFADQQVSASPPPPSVGRPRVDKDIEDLVLRMARENRSWGYDRIQGSLNHLGYTISDQTVGNILKRHGISPAPERKKPATWQAFVRCHWDMLQATEFFNSEVWSWCGLIVSYVLSFIHVSRHHVHAVRHQTMQAMRSLVRYALEVGAPGAGWVYFVKAFVRSRPHRGDAGVLRAAVSALIWGHKRPPRSQATGQVVCVSETHPSKSRDGPLPSRQRCERSFQDEHRRAA